MYRLIGPILPEDKHPLFVEMLDWCEAHLQKEIHKHDLGDVYIKFSNSLGIFF